LSNTLKFKTKISLTYLDILCTHNGIKIFNELTAFQSYQRYTEAV